MEAGNHQVVEVAEVIMVVAEGVIGINDAEAAGSSACRRGRPAAVRPIGRRIR